MEKSFWIIGTIFLLYSGVAAGSSELQIINGTTAEEGEFPYMVQVIQEISDVFLCGGTIIGPEWILTTGTCTLVDITSIVYGTNQLYNGSHKDTYNLIDVKAVFLHPKFSWTVYGFPEYDVGVIQLSEPIPFSDKVQPIQLAEDDTSIPVHEQGVLCGWGDNETWGEHMPYLQKIELQRLTDDECSEKINGLYHSKAFNPIHNICSDDYWSGLCSGDTGGPFIINGTQYGIASWSYKPCGIVPGAYTRITNPEYRSFIKNTTNI